MFKVVTNELCSLGLRRNPNIFHYNLNRWNKLPKSKLVAGNGDYGGIWVVIRYSNAKKLKKYMMNKHNKETKIFRVKIGRNLYSNSYRLKTDKVKLLEEII